MDGAVNLVETGDEVRLTLPDGSIVLNNGKVMKPVAAGQTAVGLSREIASARTSQRILSQMSRKLTDLPETPDKMNAMGAVIAYKMLGINDADIAIALNTTEERIKLLCELDAFKQLEEMLDKSVIEDGKRAANNMIARSVTRATERMIEGIESDREDIAIVAARDIMKAGGAGVNAEAEKRIGGLNIRIIRKGDRTEDDLTVEIDT